MSGARHAHYKKACVSGHFEYAAGCASSVKCWLPHNHCGRKTRPGSDFGTQIAPNGENPASVYCSQLGGSDLFGGKNAAGGGWVDTSDQTFKTVEACVFPDLSIIDSFGLFYHSNGTIRGIDLSTVLRYEAPPR